MTAEENRETIDIQLLIVHLAAETYGIDITKVREIVRMQPVTRVPGVSPLIRGIFNLRGRIIPVIDLGKCLGMDLTNEPGKKYIVLVDFEGMQAGMIVDAVTHVITVPLTSIEVSSPVIQGTGNSCCCGIAVCEKKRVILLDTDCLLAAARDMNTPAYA